MPWRGMNVSFRDMLFLLVFAYLVIGALALAHVNKKAQDAKGAAPPGSVIVELHWDDKVDADIDLWVQAPGDVPVGYSNKSGVIFNLLRDDLGHSGDPLSMNFEIAYGRGLWPGEYVVNAHFFRSADGHFPVTATAKVSVRAPNGEINNLLQRQVELTYVGQEMTIFRFKLDDHGNLVPGSVNDLHKALRSAWQQGAMKSYGETE
jgi:hypothetical protein